MTGFNRARGEASPPQLPEPSPIFLLYYNKPTFLFTKKIIKKRNLKHFKTFFHRNKHEI